MLKSYIANCVFQAGGAEDKLWIHTKNDFNAGKISFAIYNCITL